MKKRFFLSSVVTFALGGFLTLAQAAGDQTIGGMADLAVESIDNIVSLLIALCYVSGIGFASAGVLKFKQHKDNPAQVPLGTPFMLLFIGVALVWLPTMIQSTGATVFGEGDAGSATGGDIFESGGAGS